MLLSGNASTNAQPSSTLPPPPPPSHPRRTPVPAPPAALYGGPCSYITYGYPTPARMRAQHDNSEQQRCPAVIARAADSNFDLRRSYFPLFEQEGPPS